MINYNFVRRKILNYLLIIIVLIVCMHACNCVVSFIFVRWRILNYINMIKVRVVFISRVISKKVVTL